MRPRVSRTDGERLPQCLLRFAGPILCAQRGRKQRPGLGIVSLRREQGATFRFALSISALIAQRTREPKSREAMLRITVQRSLEARMRVLRASLSSKESAKVCVEVGLSRFQSDALAHEPLGLC